jgi:hypothetical protein
VIDSFVQDTISRLNTGLRPGLQQWRGDYIEVEVYYGGVKNDPRQVRKHAPAQRVIQFRLLLSFVRMQVVVLYRGDWQPGPHSSFDDKCFHARAAFHYALRKFSLLTGGSHAVQEEAMLKLLSAMNMTREAKTWEIGCGRPGLAAAISAATGQCVMCTDIDDVYDGLKDTACNEMGLRDLNANRICFGIATKLTWDELLEISQDKKGEYLPRGKKLLAALKDMYPSDATLLPLQTLGKSDVRGGGVGEKSTPRRPLRRKSGRNCSNRSDDEIESTTPAVSDAPRSGSRMVATNDYGERDDECTTPAASKKGRSGKIFSDEDDNASVGLGSARTASTAAARILHVVEGMRGDEALGHDEPGPTEQYDLFDLVSGYDGSDPNLGRGATREMDSDASWRQDVMSEMGFNDWG